MRWWRAALAVIGTLLLLGMLRLIGLDLLLEGVRRAGWVLVPIMAVQLAVYCLNAWAWWLLLDPAAPRPGYRRILGVSITGFALNFITPIVNAGGEPYRIAALTGELGLTRATGSVIAFVIVHALSSLMFWLTAIVITLLTLPHSDLPTAVLVALALMIVVAIGIVATGQRDGVVLRLSGLLSRLRLRRVSRWLAARHEAFAAVDAELMSLWRQRPRRLIAALAADTAARVVGAFEFVLIAVAIGVPLAFTTTVAMSGLLALAMNLFFIFPWELGSREASIYGVSHLAGVPLEIAALAIVVSRVRELAWAALGMLLLWWEARRRPASSPA